MNTHRRILIIEDNTDISRALSEVLSDCGHLVNLAVNGKEGMDHLIHSERFDLIILDMFLPVMNGLEFKKLIDQIPEYARIPVIAISADSFMKRKCLALGITHFLKKPFELDDLFSVMEDALPKVAK